MLSDCTLIQFPRLKDSRGNLTFAEINKHIPFEIKRIYYLTDLPVNAERGGHAHRALHQIVIPIAGSFRIHLDDGSQKRTVLLANSDSGLYLCPMIWREIDCFSSGAVCLVLASDFYSEDDYYRNYEKFIDDVTK